MNLEDKNLSLQFYNYLCNIIGSEEVVRTRREIFTEMDIVQNNTSATFISSGSKAEGLDLKGSDYDQMIHSNFQRVYERLNDVKYDPEILLLVMETNDTKPGFTKLKLVKKFVNELDLIHDWFETVGEETYISSKRVRERYLSDDMVIHGPCQSTPGEEYDNAECLRCKEWITPAQQWIHRSRTAWPHYTLVTSAVQYGVLFVPIGCKNSPHEDLQWRISFSVTEKLLINSFTHTQLLCYALMKIIVKDIIKPRHGDLLCSYFIKTIMFWLSEEVTLTEWKPENMISCFLNCIRRLIYCVEYETCLHYFIPENNLFEDRFTYEHKTILDTLRFIYMSPWICLLDTSTFQTYRLESVNSYLMTTLTASELSCFSFLSVFTNYTCTRFIGFVIKRFEKGYHFTLKNEMFMYMLCVCSRESMQSFDVHNLADRNKSFYKRHKRTLCNFKISLQSYSISSWLLLASLLYSCKRFRECLEIIHFCLPRFTPEKIYLHIANNLTEQTIFKKMEQRFGLLITCKYFIINSLNFRNPFSLLPNELQPLIEGEYMYFPPVVYSYVLSFLCYHHIGDYRGKLNALCDLELTVKERYFVFPNTKLLTTSMYRYCQGINMICVYKGILAPCES